MIFVTVGTQLPFNRLVEAIDAWAVGKDEKVLMQIGPQTESGIYLPKNVEFVDFLPPVKVKELCISARVIIAHAGMGSILTALTYRKPIIVMPRQFKFQEHRNDHQLSTAKWMEKVSGVSVAWDSAQLIELLDGVVEGASDQVISKYAEDRLIQFLTNEINQN